MGDETDFFRLVGGNSGPLDSVPESRQRSPADLETRLVITHKGYAYTHERFILDDSEANLLFLPLTRGELIDLASSPEELKAEWCVSPQRYSGIVPLLPEDFPKPQAVPKGEAVLFDYTMEKERVHYAVMAAYRVFMSWAMSRLPYATKGIFLIQSEHVQDAYDFVQCHELSRVDVDVRDDCGPLLKRQYLDGICRERSILRLAGFFSMRKQRQRLMRREGRSRAFATYELECQDYTAVRQQAIEDGIYKYHDPIPVGESRAGATVLAFPVERLGKNKK